VRAAWLGAAADALAAFVFPQGCHVCGGAVTALADGVACAGCWNDPQVTPLLFGRALCSRCGAPAAGRCAACAAPELSAVRSAGFYAGALRASVLDLKRRPLACRRLRDLLWEACAREPLLRCADLAVPVPLHPDRRAERGHNQAEVLAAALARAGGPEVVPQALARRRPAPPRRAGADRTAREAGVAGAFRAAGRLVAGRRVLLVDDVFTTGATLAECAVALRAAGAVEVCPVTVARAR
jgi:ComF family protein